jgi:transcriptional regulator with XRE-family HTH domain
VCSGCLFLDSEFERDRVFHPLELHPNTAGPSYGQVAVVQLLGKNPWSSCTEGLASKAGLDRTYVGGLERGERNPTLRVISQLAQSLEIRPSELLHRAETL